MEPITKQEFMKQLRRYQKGSISRRQFMGVTGLGLATAVLAAAMPWLKPRKAYALGGLGDRLVFSTWPNYHNPKNLERFKELTGVLVQVNVFGSNEEMLAKLQAGGTGWDVFVPTNYTISTYVELDLIEPLDLSKIANFDPATNDARFTGEGTVGGKIYAMPKNWGTTGYAVNTARVTHDMTTWKQFWDLTMSDYSGRTIVHDYQLTTIGNALKYFGYSFNSVDPDELADAEELLLKSKPHLFAITSDYQPPMRSDDAWLAVCWTGDGVQLNRDIPEIIYVVGEEGGELWTDFYAIPKKAPHREAAYAFINFLQDPYINAREAFVHGYPPTDSRANALLPDSILNNPILYPAAELMNALEFGAAVTLTDPLRAEILARFKAA
ncbi:MAG: PotD/PotF family extracellular solute-binding protein [Alphaproteobacteria bacterium]